MSQGRENPIARSRVLIAAGLALATALGVSACAPGSGSTATAPAEEPSTELGSEPIQLTLYDGQGLQAIDDALIAGFEAEFPNVSITARYDPDNVHAQNTPRVLASQNPPDLVAPIAIGDYVRDNLLLNLDEYEQAYGWDELDSQLTSGRVSADFRQGEGSLYAVPYGFVFSGTYYNKSIAEAIGMAEPPRTIAEFEEALAAAKDAGVVPIIAAGALGLGTTAFQNLLNAYAGPDAVTDWVYRADGASIDSAEGRAAAEKLVEWIEAGYFNADANATTQEDSYARFAAGEALFMFQGSWANPILADAAPAGSYGFFRAPVDGEDGSSLAITHAAAFAISSRSEHPNAAAAFLNWLHSDAARQIVLEHGNMPTSMPGSGELNVEAGSVTESLVMAFDEVTADNGIVPFVQNATNGINNGGWVPESQSLFAGRIEAEEFVRNVQAAYEEELGR